jgi:hypothetical protein
LGKSFFANLFRTSYIHLVKIKASVENTHSQTNASMTFYLPMATQLSNLNQPMVTYNEVDLPLPTGSTPALQLNGLYHRQRGGALPVTFIVDTLATQSNAAIQLALFHTPIEFLALTKGITDFQIQSAELSGSTLIISPASNANLYELMLSNLLEALQYD